MGAADESAAELDCEASIRGTTLAAKASENMLGSGLADCTFVEEASKDAEESWRLRSLELDADPSDEKRAFCFGGAGCVATLKRIVFGSACASFPATAVVTLVSVDACAAVGNADEVWNTFSNAFVCVSARASSIAPEAGVRLVPPASTCSNC